MSKLIYANLSRLKNDTSFWLITVGAFPMSAIVVIINYVHYLGQPNVNFLGISKTFYFDEYYFIAILSLPLLTAFVISLFIGRDFSQRTIRNKLISGHSHASIYLSNLITGFFAALLIYAAILLGGLIGIPLAEPTLLSGNIKISAYIIVGAFAALSCASMATLINMSLGNRIASIIVSLLAFFGIFIILYPISTALAVPEFRDDYHFVDGVMTIFPNAVKNENYISGTARTIRECIMEFFPSGNVLMMYQRIVADPIRESLLSLSFTAVTSVIGINVFRKKDLK